MISLAFSIYAIEKTLRENADKIDAQEATKIQTEIENTKSAIAGENLDQIKQAIQSLTQASHKLTEMMYSQAGAQGQPGAAPEGQPDPQAASAGQPENGGGEEEVIDAEVVDDEKK